MSVRMTTNHGDIVIELDADKAPVTVANFLGYVKSGFYDGTIFHRVIPGFMIQGGGFEPGMNQKETQAPIKNEADNGLKNLTGTLAMARTNDPQSRHRAVLHQHQGQRLPQPQRTDRAGLGLLRVRQGRRGHGRGAEHREGRHRQPRRSWRRTCRRCDHRESHCRRLID